MTIPSPSATCPACGATLSQEGACRGLCQACLIQLALESPSLMSEVGEASGEETLASSDQAFSPGEVLGKRYRIRALLGRGGMGEVWRALDLKLRVDVALKALRPQMLQDRRALELLREEVRTAREVISQYVCRVYDLVEIEGRELVSMEYIDGITLLDILRMRAPLELTEAREIASQFLAGLEAIHEAGLVHRDVKPENIMMTRSGRVVLMDFGIAKGLTEGKAGTVAGTPAYMAPEQARGEVLDTRADVFSAGVVLAEMIAPDGLRTFEARQEIWQRVHHEPPRIADSPWAPLLRKAVAGQKEQRHASAASLARALEEVTLRVAGAEDLQPYPGLASFTEDDAEYFFGRELEVEEMWKKLRRPHLLGLIGPSGAGKSSFLKAGLLPVTPTGWRAVVTTPGSRPLSALARALVPELAGDTAALQLLTSSDDLDALLGAATRWRQRHEETLLIVDQFEELFTQNPPQVEERFSRLLSRLALEADVHVLVSMRDDFLGSCSRQESLKPVFSELTPLKPLTGSALRRALVQPAVKCGYRFEEDALADEMVGEVGTERGALPMLAFAASRLWETRDRERGLLTREAYETIGGVGGALAQHAEVALEKVGEECVPIVRELFRNLVTAQGTRAARGREELLSIFDEPAASAPEARVAARVLDTLIDARLLTSYEVPAGDGEETAGPRIEIVHESLLSNWPRLVRWQTQDTEGVQLREELRQAARMWEQHGRSDDRLWTGTAYQEFQLWRERYSGGLTETEETFAKAMVSHAGRRKRRRRMALAAVLTALLAVLSVVTWSRFEATAEARRAEAAKLLALAQLRIEADPTEALAFTIASLELSDTEEARIFAMQAIAAGPPVLALDPQRSQMLMPRFSPDGRWLSLAGVAREEVLVWHQDGGDPVVLGGHPASPDNAIQAVWISGSELVTGHETEGRVRIWSFPGGELRRQIELEGRAVWRAGADHLLASVFEIDAGGAPRITRLLSWRMPEGEREDLGAVGPSTPGLGTASVFDTGERGWIYTQGSEVFYRPLPVREGSPSRRVGSHDNEAWIVSAEGERLWTRDTVTAELRRWDLSAASDEPLEVLPPMAALAEGDWYRPFLDGRWLVEEAAREGKVRLWDPLSLPGAEPREFKRSGRWWASVLDLHPDGDWIVASTRSMTELSFWPLRARQPVVVTGYDKFGQRPVVFTPDGNWLATFWPKDKMRLWRLPGRGSPEIRELEIGLLDPLSLLAIDPAGQRSFATGYGGWLAIHSLEGSGSRRLEGFSSSTYLLQGAFSPSGRLVAAATAWSAEEQKLRVWDLDSGEVEAFDLPSPSGLEDAPMVASMAFADESTLFTSGRTGLLRWDLRAGSHERISSAGAGGFAELWLSGDRRQLITLVEDPADQWCSSLVLHDLPAGSARRLETFVSCRDWPALTKMAFDETLSVMAVGRLDGSIWVGRVESDAPVLLLGHKGSIEGLAISPDGRWIASAGEDRTLRLWPMPDLDEPPPHTLPLAELLAKVGSLTNLRAVRDETTSTGWSIEIGPFPGWQEVPKW